MAEKFVHQGARSSENHSYMRIGKCIYSGNTRVYDVSEKEWDYKKQQNLNEKYMREGCQCKRCVERRAYLVKLRKALEETEDYSGLKAMGFI